jgi:hypothetical protein
MRLVILSLLLCISCGKGNLPSLDYTSPDDGHQTPVEAKPFEVVGDYKSLWPSSWSSIVMAALNDQNSSLLRIDVLDSDLERLECKNYNQFTRKDKVTFWTLFISSISHFESNFNPNTRYWESSLGKYSEGLLQLSTDDSNYHDFCNLNSSTILNPKENLTCGVSILDKQVRGGLSRVEGTLFPRRYYYWSVLTRESMIQKVTNFFKKKSAALLPGCN